MTLPNLISLNRMHLKLIDLTCRLCLATLVLLWAANAQAEPLKAFSVNSRASIEQANQGKPMVLVFWSMDCPYCIDEMKALGDALRAYPKVKLVTVCTDTAGNQTEIHQTLNQAHLPPHERWQFADDDEERLRYQVDKHWQGELPRSYFYNAQHEVKPISGSPPAAWLHGWLNRL